MTEVVTIVLLDGEGEGSVVIEVGADSGWLNRRGDVWVWLEFKG